MAWTAPRTWVTGEIVTAAHLNVHLRDNTLDLDRRTSTIQGAVGAVESTTSTSYTDLATVGPSVAVTIGAVGKALVSLYTALSNATANFALMSWGTTGATTTFATDDWSIQTNTTSDIRVGATVMFSGGVAGSTTFNAKYRATGGTAAFNARRILATALGA